MSLARRIIELGALPEPNGKDPEAIASDCLRRLARSGHARIKRNCINERRRVILENMFFSVFGQGIEPIQSKYVLDTQIIR